MPTTLNNDHTYSSTFYSPNPDGTRTRLTIVHELDGRIIKQSTDVITAPAPVDKRIKAIRADQSPFRFFLINKDAAGAYTTPCFFDGCEDLRAEYAAELVGVESNIDAGKCKPCAKGDLMRKYLPRVEALIGKTKKDNA